MPRAKRWKWIRHEGQVLHQIGMELDGTLFNPNGYDEDLVEAAIGAAVLRRHQEHVLRLPPTLDDAVAEDEG